MDPIVPLPEFVGTLLVSEAQAGIALRPDVGVIPYPGSAIRGAIGTRLLKTVCDIPGRECHGCLRVGSCLYPPLFATEGGPTGPRTPPASWGLDSVRDWPDGDLNLRIRTFGADAPSRLETLCGSLSGAIVAGEISGVPARELHWLRGPGPATTTLANRLGPVEGAHRVRVHLESPLDLKVDNVASSEPPTLALLATAIRRRAILLATAWGNPSGSPVRQPPLAVEPFVPARCKVRGVAIRRWSAHQGRAMYLRGIVGWLDYEPVNIEAMTWLRVGEILGVGRHTTMGFGRIRVEAQR